MRTLSLLLLCACGTVDVAPEPTPGVCPEPAPTFGADWMREHNCVPWGGEDATLWVCPTDTRVMVPVPSLGPEAFTYVGAP